MLVVNYRNGAVSRAALLLAVATSAFAVTYALAHRALALTPATLELFDVARVAAWIFFLATVLRFTDRPTVVSTLIVASHGLWVLLLALQLWPSFSLSLTSLSLGFVDVPLLHLLAAILTMLLIEQVYRNTRESRKQAIRYVCLGLGVPAAYELCLAAHTVLFGAPSTILALPRGFIIALAAPLMAVGLQRVVHWDVGIFVSRQIVFYTGSVMATGIYLLSMAIAGYSIQSLNLAWGGLLQGAFFLAAIGLFLWILFSDTVRSAAKVWLHKHFYENKYDYRGEWLRLTRTLSTASDGESFGERSVSGLAQIVGAEAGALWTIDHESQAFVREFALEKPLSSEQLPLDHPLVEFMEQRRWVLDVSEARRAPDRYESIEHTLDAVPFERSALLVPLQHENRLRGFIELDRRPDAGALNYEDHDLLKTAGQQIASYLAQRDTARLLAESRQFEAFNKFTAFVMHDLNNLIAQQRLIVQNAKKFRDNPAFVDDAFKTIDNSVRRMEGLLTQLRERSAVGATQRVDVIPLVNSAIDRAAERQPVPVTETAGTPGAVRADPDRLEAVVGHMIRNAQEATSADGRVRVTVRAVRESDSVEVAIADDGVGMTPEFIRDQLFSPFVSTKGSKGMGIGVYQTREYLRLLGGDLTVDSTPGQGTTMRLSIPVASDAAS